MSSSRYSDSTAVHEAEVTPRGHRATRWPKPDALSIVLFLGWAAGIAVSTIVPFLIVPPTASDPVPADVGIAFAALITGFGGALAQLWIILFGVFLILVSTGGLLFEYYVGERAPLR